MRQADGFEYTLCCVVYLDLLLVGFGHVGREFARLLLDRSVRLRVEHGLIWRVAGIATRSHGAAFDASGLDLVHALRLAEHGSSLGELSQPDGGRILPADASGLDLIRHATGESRLRRLQQLVVVETTVLDIERGQPAIDHTCAALRGGAHVVTANKGPVAFSYREIAAAAHGARRQFLFEGAVMDGIPVFNLVRQTLPCIEIEGFRGVVNATTNFVLDAMEAGRSFDEALADMVRAGIAEADPSLDVDGWDAAAKTAALINVLMRGTVTPHTIERSGIRSVTREHVEDAARQGKRLRLVARAERREGVPVGHVGVEELDVADPLAGLTGQQNMLVLKTDLLGDIGIHQLGGGLTQTAYALLGDLVTVARTVGGNET
jgi:homoserine dehydrogenase